MFVDGFFAGCITSLILSFTLAVMADCEVKDRRIERAIERDAAEYNKESHEIEWSDPAVKYICTGD
jgi:uridine kinase